MARVVAPAVKVVFCEGRPGSLDDLLLTNLITGGQVVIVPVGGKHAMRAFIEGYLNAYPADMQPDYLAFRDRDFDEEPPDLAGLIRLRGEKPIWLSHRAAIENYFIDGKLLHQYWSESAKTPGWSHGPAPAIDVIEEHIQESARELLDYQAVRWGLAKLKPAPRWPEISTSWSKGGSGDIPASLDYDHCLAQARKLVTSFQDQIQGIDLDHLEEHTRSYRERLNEPDFFPERKYQFWFHGKDHLVQLCRRLAANFPRRHYATWAAQHIEAGKHPDLKQLVDLVRESDV